MRRQSSTFFFFESVHTQIDIYHAESKYPGKKKRYLPVHVVPVPVYPGLQVQL